MSSKEKLWIIWFGNEMSVARKQALYFIIKQSCFEIELITDDNYMEYVKKEYPIPDSFDLLSVTHKSDYMRTYIMHHYGGVYTDVKPYNINWHDVLEKLYSDENIWGTGYPLPAGQNHCLNRVYNIDDMCNATMYMGYGWFAYKKNTPMTEFWLNTSNDSLHELKPGLLKQNGKFHPRAVPKGIFQQTEDDTNIYPEGYPLLWGRLMADNQLAQHKYLKHMDVSFPAKWFKPTQYR